MALTSLIGALGQSPRTFEVASIKPSHSSSDESNVDSTKGGRLTCTNVSLKELIRLAFGVKDYQIQGAPGWIDTDRYDIAAKAASPGNTNIEELKSLLRQLLADRFGMTFHRETRELPMYSLVVGKNGPKLTQDNDSPFTRTRTGCGHLAGTRVTVDVLATMLSRLLEHDVLNRTGLLGKFDFKLDWTPDAGPCPAPADAPDLPSFTAALQEQLGLKLESTKGEAAILIVDHLERRPSEN